MGSPHSLLSQLKMKFLVALSLFSTSLAAPLPEADPQLLTYNNLQPAAPFTTQPIISYGHQPLAVANFASPTGTTRTYNQPPVTSYARPAFTSYARPVVHQVQTVATAPVVHHVGYKVHHQVQHVPQVYVQKHVTHHTTQHVINHAPVVGSPVVGTYTGLPVAGLPLAGLPVVAAAAEKTE